MHTVSWRADSVAFDSRRLTEVAFLATAPRGADTHRMSLPREVLPGRCYLITRRCTQRTFLMRPDAATNNPRTVADNLQSAVVKVPHHGSKTSSTQLFVTATHAQTAIISVGQYSTFGHPHREVVERWLASGAQVLTTGKCGTITVTTDGADLTVTGMQSRIAGELPCPLAH